MPTDNLTQTIKETYDELVTERERIVCILNDKRAALESATKALCEAETKCSLAVRAENTIRNKHRELIDYCSRFQRNHKHC